MKKENKNRILVTGCAGFIGMHLCKKLFELGYDVIGIDNLNDYYDVNLKLERLSLLQCNPSFNFIKNDISNMDTLEDVFKTHKPDKVVNLAAQAGVRYSLINPQSYMDSNIIGFMNVLECCRYYDVNGLVYASSSSVYGGNKTTPFSELDIVDNPLSIYAASKKANELMAHSYNHLFGIRSTGLRFFTVYGAWGRPDMSYYSFTDRILNNEPIELYGDGKVERDFTYIDDIVYGITSAISNNYNYEIFNLGNSKCEKVLKLIRYIEKKLNKKANIVYKPLKLGDVKKTYANITKSKKMLGYSPKVNINIGIGCFLDWYKNYYNIN